MKNSKVGSPKLGLKSKFWTCTKCKAYAAGTSEMKLTGQTLEDVILHVQGVNTNISWNLGKVVIVKNLGSDISTGEPGKAENKVNTIPHKKVVEVVRLDNKRIKIPYSNASQDKTSYNPCKSVNSGVLHP